VVCVSRPRLGDSLFSFYLDLYCRRAIRNGKKIKKKSKKKKKKKKCAIPLHDRGPGLSAPVGLGERLIGHRAGPAGGRRALGSALITPTNSWTDAHKQTAAGASRLTLSPPAAGFRRLDCPHRHGGPDRTATETSGRRNRRPHHSRNCR